MNEWGFLPAVEMTGMVGRHVELRYEGDILRNRWGFLTLPLVGIRNDGSELRDLPNLVKSKTGLATILLKTMKAKKKASRLNPEAFYILFQLNLTRQQSIYI
ncbi:MAG: hypothetical protein RIC03_02990 [Cyclobacteriaceae bacterium]